MSRLAFFLCASALALGCGDDGNGGSAADAAQNQPDAVAVIDAAPSFDADPLAITTLEETGLYSDFAGGIVAPGVMEFEPQGVLWTDAATKRRWVYLPDGATIDTSDMNFWVMPEGTKLWKEFTRDGVSVETRLIWKHGPMPDDWIAFAFAWNAEQTEAISVPAGAADVLGTDHDIPSRRDCRRCHNLIDDHALGFGAIQLDHDLGEVNLASLVGDGRLSSPPTPPAMVGDPYFPLPGDATAQTAIKYFHGNCGTCHHERSEIMNNTTINLRLNVANLATIEDTPVYSTAVGGTVLIPLGQGETALIEPGDPSTSAVYIRMGARGTLYDMPPLGTELVDPTGRPAIAAWINGL